LVVLMVALLASLGAKRILSGQRQPWRRIALLLALILALAVVSYFVLPRAWLVYAIHGALLGSLALLGILAVMFLASRQSSLAPVLLVGVVAFDLASAAWPLQGFGTRQLASTPPPAVRTILEQHTDDLAPPRIYRSNQTDEAVNKWVPASTNAEGEFRLVQTLVTNTVNAWGIATLPGYDAAIPALVDKVWDAGLGIGQSALRLLGAAYVILPVANPAAPANDRPGLEPVLDPLPGARLYRVPGSLPRVYLARHSEVLPDPQALARIYDPDVIAGNSVWLAPEGSLRALASPPGRAGDCRLQAYRNNHISALCRADQPAVAVFVEQYARGWHATVDGRPTELVRANVIMRALPLAAGSHTIELDYHTPGLAVGGAISIASLLMLGALLLRRRRP